MTPVVPSISVSILNCRAVGQPFPLLQNLGTTSNTTKRYYGLVSMVLSAVVFVPDSTLYSWLATHDKIPPSKETAERWKKMAAVEYDFYYFIKKRFHEQMLTLGLL